MASFLVKQVKRPYLVASIVLHGLLLCVPLLPQPSADAPTPQPIKLTRLPLSSKPAPVPALKPSPTQQPPLLPNPSQTIPPSSPPPSSSVPPLSISPPSATLSPVATSPSPPTPIAATPTPSVSPSPIPTPSISPSPTSSIASDPLADFPHVSGAQAGCAGSERCWQTADTQWRAIADNIQQELKDKGYALESLPLADETGRQVYRVSKAGEDPYYLSFISTPQGTVYSSTERPMTPEEMSILSGF